MAKVRLGGDRELNVFGDAAVYSTTRTWPAHVGTPLMAKAGSRMHRFPAAKSYSKPKSNQCLTAAALIAVVANSHPLCL